MITKHPCMRPSFSCLKSARIHVSCQGPTSSGLENHGMVQSSLCCSGQCFRVSKAELFVFVSRPQHVPLNLRVLALSLQHSVSTESTHTSATRQSSDAMAGPLVNVVRKIMEYSTLSYLFRKFVMPVRTTRARTNYSNSLTGDIPVYTQTETEKRASPNAPSSGIGCG